MYAKEVTRTKKRVNLRITTNKEFPLVPFSHPQEQCKTVLDSISHQINNQHSELAGHHLLSIFKMAEMQVIMPEVSGSCRLMLAKEALFFSVLLAVLVSLCSNWSGQRRMT